MKLFDNITKTRFGWTLSALTFTTLLVAGLIIWQLYEMRPKLYCALAEAASPEATNACVVILGKIIDVKDHNLIGLMVILGLTVVSILAVALGLKISAQGPGNTKVDVGRETTTVESDDTTVHIPTPPSG